jgi:hypothetical protein
MAVKGHQGGTAPRTHRVGDLQFAGMVSAGLIACVLVAGALLAPLTGRSGHTGPGPSHPREQTVRLSPPVPPAVGALPQPDAARHERTAPRSDAVTLVRLQGPASGSRPSLSASDGEARGRLPERAAAMDSDADGLPDLWEIQYGLDPHSAADARADSDHDGLDNLTELRLHTAPSQRDSNGDGVLDGDEDSDRDGAPNLVEQRAGTDPGSDEDVPGDQETPNPGPVVTEPDPDVVVDDGGSGADPPPAPPGDDDPPSPPLPPPPSETPQAPAPAPDAPPAPAPAPDLPAPAPDVPAPAPAPAPDLPPQPQP